SRLRNECAASPAKSAFVRSSRKRRTRNFAEGNPFSPKRASNNGCRGRRGMGPRTSEASSAHCSAKGPMSVRQALPSRSSADSASRRSRSNITAVPSSRGCASADHASSTVHRRALRIFVYTSLSGRNRRPLGDADSAISLALQSRSIQSNQLPVPPHSGLPLFCHGGEPVLPEHCTYLGGWL